MCFVCATGLVLPAWTRTAPPPPEIFPPPFRWDGDAWRREPYALGLEPAVGGLAWWTGVAGFVFEVGGTRIAFDPFVSRPSLVDALTRAPSIDRDLVARTFPSLDAVFVGHAHYDHAMDVPAAAAASPRARIHGSRTTVDLLARLGVDPARTVAVRDAETFEVGPFRVTAVASAHGFVPFHTTFLDRFDLSPGEVPRTPARYPRGDVFAWRLEVLGRTFHLQGSAGIDDFALKRQPPCDVLIACLAARKGTPRYLERLGSSLRPKVLVPCHHDDFFRPYGESPVPVRTLRWPAFMEEHAALARAHATRLFLPPYWTSFAF